MSLVEARAEYFADLTGCPSTKEYYKRNLGRLRASKVQEITPRNLYRIIDGLARTSRIQAIRSYSVFFNWCFRRHYLETSPTARMVVGNRRPEIAFSPMMS